MPAHVPTDLGFLGLVLSNYLVEQTERQAVHRFVVCAMQASEPAPRLVLWVFQPLITLSIPPLERPCDACKLLYKPGATQPDMAQHIPLVLPAEVMHCTMPCKTAHRYTLPRAVSWATGTWDGFLVDGYETTYAGPWAYQARQFRPRHRAPRRRYGAGTFGSE